MFTLFNWIYWIRTLDMFNEICVLFFFFFFFNSFIFYRLFTNIGVKIEIKLCFYAFYIKLIERGATFNFEIDNRVMSMS